LWMLLDGFARIDRLIAKRACSLRTRREKLLMLDQPAITMREAFPLTHKLAIGTELTRLDRYRLLTDRAQPNNIAHLRTRQRLTKRALEVNTPDLALTTWRLDPHEIRHRTLWIVAIA